MPLQATSGAASYDGFGGGVPFTPTYIEDVFSTYLYTGNGSTQTITNGIDLSTNGGLVWIKNRSSAYTHVLVDTNRGTDKVLCSNNTNAEQTGDPGFVTQFNSNGFAIGDQARVNLSSSNFASWTFRKQPKFFDVVTYTGDGANNKTISHALGSTPGCIIVKRTDNIGGWVVYHRGTSVPNNTYLTLQTTNAATNLGVDRWSVTGTTFNANNNDLSLNESGATYVAYLFAHNAGGFGLSGSDNVISCGSFTTDGSGNATVTLGYEPQWLLLKQSTGSAASWVVVDSMRGFVSGAATTTSDDATLNPNSANAEGTNNVGRPTATGFEYGGSVASQTFIYIAIRRGPMKTPTDATKVFTPTVYTGTNVDNRLVDTTIAPDMVWVRQRDSTTVAGMVVGDRMRARPYLLTGSTAAEVNDADAFDQQLVGTTEYGTAFSSMNGFWCGNDATARLNTSTTANNQIAEAFKRAPGFFDVVCYTGTGSSATSYSHNLGVAPELIINKVRSASGSNWIATFNFTSTNYVLAALNLTIAGDTFLYTDGASIEARPTSTAMRFTGGVPAVNDSGQTYVAYLFASCPGVSKVGSYTGTGALQTVNCGFTGGARFVLIKRTDSTGDWWVYDSARGISSGNDPYLLLNTTDAEVTGTNYVDTTSVGFQVTAAAPAGLNANGGTYLFLAIA